MSTAYKVDERILRDIVRRGVTTVSDDDKIQFTIYYKNQKVNNIIMKNSPKECDKDISRVGVIYQYFCQLGDCKLQNNSYIGMTTTTLSRRLTSHLQAGTPKMHTIQKHNIHLTREMLVNNTTILDGDNNKKRLQIKEALYISNKKPTMNIQIGTTSIQLPSQN